MRDLLENIIEPSKVISEQYDSSVIEKKDGTSAIGFVTGEDSRALFVAPNAAMRNDTVEIPLAEIERRKPHPVSPMPPGLINGLNGDELLDLVAYILSGGDRKDRAFASP